MRRLPERRFGVPPLREAPDDEAPADGADEFEGDAVHPHALGAERVDVDVGGAVPPHGVAERDVAHPALELDGAGDEVDAAGVGHGLDVSAADRGRRGRAATVYAIRAAGVAAQFAWTRDLSDRAQHGREAEGGRLAVEEETGDDGAHHVRAGTALASTIEGLAASPRRFRRSSSATFAVALGGVTKADKEKYYHEIRISLSYNK